MSIHFCKYFDNTLYFVCTYKASINAVDFKNQVYWSSFCYGIPHLKTKEWFQVLWKHRQEPNSSKQGIKLVLGYSYVTYVQLYHSYDVVDWESRELT